jgi:chromosome segregation ATPase
MLAGAGLAYTVYEENLRRLDQANARIMDLEDRLSMVGDSAEETTGNIIERVDFNFSEIDKLWAARNATNANVTDLTGRVAITETRSQENLTLVEETSQRLLQATNLVEENRRSVAELRQASERLAANVNNMNNTLQEVRGVAQEVVNLRAEISTAEGASGGLNDRLMRVEEAVEAIDAYRLQVNQTVLRLQQQIEDMRAN